MMLIYFILSNAMILSILLMSVSVLAFLIFFEYSVTKNIIQNARAINLKSLHDYTKNRKPKYVNSIFSQRTDVDVIFKNKSMSIKKMLTNFNMTDHYIGMSEWLS